MSANKRPFADTGYDCKQFALTSPISPMQAVQSGEMLAGMDPWLTLNFSASALARYLTREDPALHRYAIMLEAKLAGVIAIRYPWLRGPFIEMLGLTDSYQGQNIGKKLLQWVEMETCTEAKNIWVTASSFNQRALGFYQRQGFQQAGLLEGLICQDHDEILLRKCIEPMRPD